MKCVVRDSIVGIVTHYKLDCLGIESRLAWTFLLPSRPALIPIQYIRYLISFLGLSGHGGALSNHTHLVPEWMCMCVCLCGGVKWIAQFEPRLYTILTFTILTLFSSLLFQWTIVPAEEQSLTRSRTVWWLNPGLHKIFCSCPDLTKVAHDFFSGVSGRGVALSTRTHLVWKWKKEVCVFFCVCVAIEECMFNTVAHGMLEG